MTRLWRAVQLLACVLLLHGCKERQQSVVSKQAADESPRVTPQAPIAVHSPHLGPAGPDTSLIDSEPQDPHADLRGGDYILSVFQKELGEAPRIGWFLSKRFLAAEKHPRLYIYSTDAVIDTAVFERTLSATQHDSLARQEHLACDSKGPLAEYQLDSTPRRQIGRAFYTSRLPAGTVRATLAFRAPAASELAAARALLAPARSSVVYRDTILGGSPGNTSYSVTALYDSATHGLLKSALILLDSASRVVGSQVKVSSDFACDGCGEPIYEEGLGRLYDVMNMFELPGFAYPVLLFDTGTVEGRALSLVTFTPEGGYNEYRIYEYVVTCILGPDQMD